jgi:uncharacterized protein (TIGR02646 family)
MFNTDRPFPAPDCLNDKKYNTEEVVNLLHSMFHGKCYLCEQDELSDPEIEHFDPHEGDVNKKYDWNNLYYACSRCNSIKSTTYKNLLDCCDSNTDVFRAIKCVVASNPDDPINIIAMPFIQNPQTINTTVELLRKCYNENNTALRGITKINLVEKIFNHYTDMLIHRRTLRDKKSTKTDKQHAKESIESMLKVHFPFAVFWRWHVLSDSFLATELEDLIDF